MKRFSLFLATTFVILGGFTYAIGADHLLITEFCVTPTNGEFVEIYNPTGSIIDLSNYYLTDATYANGGNYYYNIVLQNGTGGAAGPGNYYDFNAKFPEGATIAPGEYQTVAFKNTDFSSTYGLDANYELFSTDPSVPDMIPAEEGSIDENAGLTNGGEVLILYYWDGESDLVEDIDYIVWGDKAEAVDKTGVSIDGPDPDSEPSTYLDDTPIADQTIVDADNDGDEYPHDPGKSAQRSGIVECGETLTGGNGITGNDETSEDMSYAGGCWTVNATPTPGSGPFAPRIISVTWTPYVPLTTEPVVVKAVVEDVSKVGVDTVQVIYTLNGGSPITLNAIPTTADTFEATIPPQGNAALVEFRIRAVDDSSNVTLYPYVNGYFSGVTPIGDLRVNDADGRNIYRYYGVRVTGVATLETGILREQGNGVDFYIQDESGGINIFDYDDASLVNRGDSVIVAGEIYQYNGNLEITKVNGVTFITNLGSGTLPPLTMMTCSDWGEDYEGLLVAVPYVSNAGTGDPWPGPDTSADIAIFDTALTDTVYMRIENGTNIDGWPEPTWPKDVVGIFTQYDMRSPYTWYYQLLPRDTADFRPAGSLPGVHSSNLGFIPIAFSLSQNYPNPFNSATQIPFSLSKDAKVNLSIFNIVGKKVAELLNRRINAGNYEVNWRADGWASGVYFCRLQVGNRSAIRKLVLLK